MSKFAKTCHVIARLFVYLCVILVLLLYFFKPGVLEWAQTIFPAADNGSWLVVVTTLSIAAVLFATSELAFKGLQDNEFMATLSTSVLKPAYENFDLSDKRFSKAVKSERELNETLRDISDGKERVMQELAWEKQNSRKLQKRAVGNKIVVLFFLLAGLAFFLYPVVFYLLTKRLPWVQSGTVLDYFSIVALILTMVIVLECGNNQGLLRRLNTILGIRGRSDDISESEAAADTVAAAPVYLYSAPAPVTVTPVSSPVAAAATTAGAAVSEESVQEAAAAPTAAAAPATTLPPEEIWHPENWSGVPEEAAAENESSDTSFIHLTPEEPDESNNE